MSFANMIRRRLLFLFLVVFGVSLVTFVISHMIPGNPAEMIAGDKAPKELVEKIYKDMGLDRPVLVQYFTYISNLLQGDLGISIRTQRPVLNDILIFFPATLELAVVALSISIIFGVPLGVISALRKDKAVDHIGHAVSVTGISTPAFWLGLLLIYFFYGKLGILPASGRIDSSIAPPAHITGLYLVDSLIAGDWPAFKSTVNHLILPALTLGFIHLGVVMRQIRSAMLEVLREDYIRTARASGLSPTRIVLDYALRNALIPSVTIIGLAFGDLLYGAVLTETIFAWPGMGNYVVLSITALDFPAIMGFTIVASTVYVLVNLMVDLLYAALDPQIRAIG
jgi:peptide/nickel transport system permease protein